MSRRESNWVEFFASDCFDQISTTGKKVKTKECKPNRKYPVIDQGQSDIAGFVDDQSKLIEVESPIVVFGDHTRAIKWVEKNFVPGADGTKLLDPKPYLIRRFAYHQLRSLEIPDKGYSRHFKYLKELSFFVEGIQNSVSA